MPNWLRWTLCVPTALLTFLLVNGMNRVAFLTIFGDPNQLLFKVITILIEGTVGVTALLYVLCKMAPNRKQTTLIVASSVIGLLSVLGIAFQMIDPNVAAPLWQILLPGMLSIGSCLCCYKQFVSRGWVY